MSCADSYFTPNKFKNVTFKKYILNTSVFLHQLG